MDNLKEELNNDVINNLEEYNDVLNNSEEEEENNELQNEEKKDINKNPEKQEKINEKQNDENIIEKEEKNDKDDKNYLKGNNNFKTLKKHLNNYKKIVKLIYDKKTKCISFSYIFSQIYLLLIAAILAIIYPDKFYKIANNINKIIIGEKNKIIIGFEFGSTQSGYQIFYDSIIDFKNEYIIPNELIFDNYFKKGLAIGREAKGYPKKNIELENKLYFTKFKRNLEPKNKNNLLISTIPIGGQLENDIFIKEFLILIKEHILKNVIEINYLNIKDVKWILTVPPLWDENAKNKLKELAIKAEMRNVEIALEPEVISLAIFHDKNIDKSLFKPQKSFLLVNMGSLTIDFTAMKILDKNYNLEQLLQPVSFDFGSNYINDEIYNIIETVYGKKKLDQVKKKDYFLWLKIFEMIETMKQSIDENEVNISNIHIYFNNERCSSISDKCKFTYNGTEITYTSSNISIPNHLIKNIINDIGDKIVNKINQQLRDTKEDINYIILTGGFSNSNILRKKIIMPISIGISLDNNKFHTFVKKEESVDITSIYSTNIRVNDNSILFYYSSKKREINNENKMFLDEIKLPYIDSTDKRNITILTKFSSYISVEVKEKGMNEVINKILYYPPNIDKEK